MLQLQPIRFLKTFLLDKYFLLPKLIQFFSCMTLYYSLLSLLKSISCDIWFWIWSRYVSLSNLIMMWRILQKKWTRTRRNSARSIMRAKLFTKNSIEKWNVLRLGMEECVWINKHESSLKKTKFSGKEACKSQRIFQMPRIGVADDKVAQYAGLHYYTDKELQVQSESACRLACDIENEFLCRSFLYRGAPQGSAYNCQLFHLDHWTLPDGPSTYLNAERPLIDNGERVGTYFENYCESEGGSLKFYSSFWEIILWKKCFYNNCSM